MTSRTALLDTLVWAAGGQRTPRFEEIATDELLHALLRHRLETRLLFRSRAEGVVVPPDVLEEVTARHEKYVRVVGEQIATFQRLQQELAASAPDARVLPIKGFGLYALTGLEEHVRYSWDVDVIGTDPAAVVEAARAITEEGYHFHGEDHPYVYAHMEGIEVHTRYLVTSFPKGVGPEGCDPRLNPGVLRLDEPFVAAPLDLRGPRGEPGTGQHAAGRRAQRRDGAADPPRAHLRRVRDRDAAVPVGDRAPGGWRCARSASWCAASFRRRGLPWPGRAA